MFYSIKVLAKVLAKSVLDGIRDMYIYIYIHIYIYIYVIYFCYLVNPKTLSKKVQEAKSILKIQRKCERIT